MSGNRIEIKDVTPNQFNPKTHKNNSDRFNPNNGIYVRKSQGTFQALRRNGSWLLLLLFGLTPWLSYDNHQAILLDFWNQKFYFLAQRCFRKTSLCWQYYLLLRHLLYSLLPLFWAEFGVATSAHKRYGLLYSSGLKRN